MCGLADQSRTGTVRKANSRPQLQRGAKARRRLSIKKEVVPVDGLDWNQFFELLDEWNRDLEALDAPELKVPEAGL